MVSSAKSELNSLSTWARYMYFVLVCTAVERGMRYIVLYLPSSISLQCLDTVGWATGRASGLQNKLCGRPHNMPPCKLTFDLLTVKVVSESHMTWATLCK